MKWIDVNDILPEDSRMVLAAEFSNGNAWYYIAEINLFDVYNPIWLEVQEYRTIEPTHWMELPKSPYEN